MSVAVDNIARAMAASAMSGGGGGGSSAKGMPLIRAEGTNVDITIPSNHACVCIDAPTNIRATLEMPQGAVYPVWVLTFIAGAECVCNITAPTGMQISYPDGTPTLTQGKLYELSFAADSQWYIVGLFKEADVTFE